MNIKTGHTVYELVRSFNPNTNLPIVPATFTNTIYSNGSIDTGTTVNINLTNSNEGIYTISWSASTYGTYQVHILNDTTNVVYISEIYNVKPDSEIDTTATVYVGL